MPVRKKEVGELENATNNKSGFKYLLAALGPGMILAATSVGPGSIVSFTNAGAGFGYTLCWWAVLILVFRAIFTIAMNKYTVVTGKPIMVGIRDTYGPVWAILAGIFAFIGQCVYGIGNCIGVGLALVILFPAIPLPVGAIIGVVVCALLYFLKGLYKKIESFMKVLIAIMVIIFIAAWIGTSSIPYDGTVSHSFFGMPDGATAIMLSLMGTTASLGTVAYGSSLVKEKGFTTDDIKKKGILADVFGGVVVLGIISLSCYFVGANLFPGSPIGTGMDLANGLAGVLGSFIRPIFGIAFLAAALSSEMMAPKLGINLLLQALGRKSGMENKSENIISIIMMVFALIVVLSYGGVPAQLLTLAQIGGVINTPILGLLTIMLINRKSDMKEFKASIGLTIALIVSYAAVLYMVVNNLIGVIKSFGG